MPRIALVAFGLAALERVRSNDPEKAIHDAEAFDIHLAFGACRQVDELVENEMLMLAKAAVLHAAQPLDARCLVARQKETVPGARDGGQVLVERVLDVSQGPPVGKGENELPDKLQFAVAGHGRFLREC